MREIMLILALVGMMIFTSLQYVENLKLVFDDNNEKEDENE